MNQFSYVDIFATKGIEYLVIIAFFILIIPFWKLLTAEESVIPEIGVNTAQGFLTRLLDSLPKGIFLDPTHSWAFMEGSGRVKVGVDNFLLATTGPIKYADTIRPGSLIKRGQIMASIKSGNRTLRVYSPVSGIIKHYNSNANKCVSGKDVYQKGWLYLIEPTHWIQEIKNLYFAKKAEKWIQTELNRLRDFFAFSTRKFGFDPGMVVLQEGGPIEEAALQDMPEEFWYEFQVEFIDAMRKFES